MSLTPIGLDRWLDEEIARAHVRHAIDRDRRYERWLLGVIVLTCAVYLAWCAVTNECESPAGRAHRPASLRWEAARNTATSSLVRAERLAQPSSAADLSSVALRRAHNEIGQVAPRREQQGGPASLRAGVSSVHDCDGARQFQSVAQHGRAPGTEAPGGCAFESRPAGLDAAGDCPHRAAVPKQVGIGCVEPATRIPLAELGVSLGAWPKAHALQPTDDRVEPTPDRGHHALF